MLLHAQDWAQIEHLLPQVAQALLARGWRMACAESCTGGLLAGVCTALPGSSDWFDRGVVSYSNAAKTELLGVEAPLIVAHGAVSEPTALAMARGMLLRSQAHVSVAITGIAGPGGGSPDKPVGEVWLAWAWRSALDAPNRVVEAQRLRLPGDRAAVRGLTVQRGLERVLALAGSVV